MAQGFIRGCLDQRIDVLIKTEEDTLDIRHDARGLLMHEQAQRFGVVIEKGLDNARLRTYEVRALSGFYHDGISTPFKVAYVQEQEMKTGKPHAFSVLTTMTE